MKEEEYFEILAKRLILFSLKGRIWDNVLGSKFKMYLALGHVCICYNQ